MSDLLSNIAWRITYFDPALFDWSDLPDPVPVEWTIPQAMFGNSMSGLAKPGKLKYTSPNYMYEVPTIGNGFMQVWSPQHMDAYFAKNIKNDIMFKAEYSDGAVLTVYNREPGTTGTNAFWRLERSGYNTVQSQGSFTSPNVHTQLLKDNDPESMIVFNYCYDATYQIDTSFYRNNFGWLATKFEGSGRWEYSEFPYLMFAVGTEARSQEIYDILEGSQIDNPEVGPENEGDGENDADFQYVDQSIDFPDLPTTDGLSTGIISLYKMNTGLLNSLSRVLWDDNFFNNIVKNFDSPLENVISLNILPINVSGTEAEVMIGNFMTSIIGEKIHGQFIDLDGGSVHVQKIFGHQFDFKPVNELQIYIPYIGYRSLDLDDCIGGELYLKYRVDLLTGNLLAMIRVVNDPERYDHDSVEYYFEGNCASSIPLCGANYMNYYGNLIGGAMRTASGMVTGNAMQGLSGASSMISSKPEYQRSGSIRGNFGFMGNQTAFIMMSSPVSGIAGNLQTERGLRSNRFSKFDILTGFQKINSFHPNSALSSECTEEELAEIENLLKEGVFF